MNGLSSATALSRHLRSNIPYVKNGELLKFQGWLRVDLALRPAQEEVWAAVMDQVLDELGEQWGVEICA